MPREDTQFKPGNQRGPGRPKGSKNKISEDFLQSFHKIWLERGEAALLRMVDERPAEFIKVAASLIPKDYHVVQQSVVEKPGISVALTPRMTGLIKKFKKHGVEVEEIPAQRES